MTDITLRIEGTLWTSPRAWLAAREHIATRFARVCGDLAVPTSTDSWTADLATDLAAIETWAGDQIDWRRELARFFDEHLPVYVRPDRATNQQVRTLSAQHTITAVTILPTDAADSLLRHLGILRNITTVLPETGASADNEATLPSLA
jgi:hypothetical protein